MICFCSAVWMWTIPESGARGARLDGAVRWEGFWIDPFFLHTHDRRAYERCCMDRRLPRAMEYGGWLAGFSMAYL